MWMQILRAAGFPIFGDAFPCGWDGALKPANPGGFFESKLRDGIYFATNQDPATGYACLMEARLVEQVEQGAAKTPFLAFGDRVTIDMKDPQGRSVFGAIDHVVERYA